MDEKRGYSLDSRVIIGVLIVIFGLLFFLENLGLLEDVRIWRFWPLILVVIGLAKLLQPRENRRLLAGLILLILGILFQLSNLETIHFRIWQLWPLIIILIGIGILAPGLWNLRKGPLNRDQIDLTFLLSGGEFRVTSRELRGGKITAVMGGCTLDLKDAGMATDEITIDIFAMMGGVEIIVPADWQVTMQGFPLLGGMTNATASAAVNREGRSTSSGAKRLVVTGVAIMGGVEVKN